MIRSLLLVSLAYSSVSFAPVQEPAPKSADTAKYRIRLHVMDMSIEDSWFEDRYRHAIGKDAAVFVSGNAQDGIAVDFGAKKASHTSGCAVTVRLRRSEAGREIAEVSGTWWKDLIRNGEPSHGSLAEVDGDVFVSKPVGESGGAALKFAIQAKADGRQVVLMGGSHIVIPDKK